MCKGPKAMGNLLNSRFLGAAQSALAVEKTVKNQGVARGMEEKSANVFSLKRGSLCEQGGGNPVCSQ